MRLAIADPPYPPNLLATGGAQRATRWYAAGSTRNAGGGYQPADVHPAAAEWNDPARHRALLADLVAGYDGWAIATTPDAVAAVYPPLPVGTRLLVWHKLRPIPTGARINSSWEAVLLYPPAARRAAAAAAQVSDVLRCPPPSGAFAGAKPFAWTRWVLEALGYDQDTDTVDDLFPGSGAVRRAVDQQALWSAHTEFDTTMGR